LGPDSGFGSAPARIGDQRHPGRSESRLVKGPV
jgi:hypothetical protein